MANTVTIKIKPETKAMMDTFAAKKLATEGKTMTNDDVISELVRIADEEVYRRVKEQSGKLEKPKK